MEILEAFDLTRCAHSAADLAGCDPKTVSRHVDRRDRGHDPHARVHRPMKIDPYRSKIEELVERSAGRVRADIVHERLAALGFVGTERTTRRAVRLAKTAYRAGRRRTYRPWITEPGMWLQFDWGHGPVIDGRPTLLFCAWLAWSRFRVVIPTWDRTMGSLLACLDATLRLVGGVPTYLLTDNERTVTIDRIARIPVRHPEIVAAGRHYGTAILACAPFDPESKGGSESTVKIAKADLVPTEANLLPAYPSFAALAAACVAVCATVNGRVHRETGRRPDDLLAIERRHLHGLPAEPYTAALGETRTVGDDQTIRLGSVRYSTPRQFVGTEVWVRVAGDEVVIIARTETGLAEIARHARSTPGNPRLDDAH
jgi:transposase